LLIISLKLIVIDPMELVLLLAAANCRFSVCTETSGLPKHKAIVNERRCAVI